MLPAQDTHDIRPLQQLQQQHAWTAVGRLVCGCLTSQTHSRPCMLVQSIVEGGVGLGVVTVL